VAVAQCTYFRLVPGTSRPTASNHLANKQLTPIVPCGSNQIAAHPEPVMLESRSVWPMIANLTSWEAFRPWKGGPELHPSELRLVVFLLHQPSSCDKIRRSPVNTAPHEANHIELG
jgi:hypothetical protein